MKLKNIFTLYTGGFAALVIIIGILESAGILQLQGISWIFMGFSVLVYAMIGFITHRETHKNPTNTLQL